MDVNFFYYFIYDKIYTDKHLHAFVNFFFKKLLLRNYWLDFYQISLECPLDRG